MKKLILILLLLTSCNETSNKSFPYTHFKGRDEDQMVYRARVPPHFHRVEMEPGTSLYDTTQPIASFLIQERDEKVRITIHTFPSNSIEERIPIQAQIERWKKQTNPPFLTKEVSWGGFLGTVLEGTDILAWSMQLDPLHYQTLGFFAGDPKIKNYHHQMQADYTIKATGPSKMLEKYHQSISTFAKTFELIDPIPMR